MKLSRTEFVSYSVMRYVEEGRKVGVIYPDVTKAFILCQYGIFGSSNDKEWMNIHLTELKTAHLNSGSQ